MRPQGKIRRNDLAVGGIREETMEGHSGQQHDRDCSLTARRRAPPEVADEKFKNLRPTRAHSLVIGVDRTP